MGVSGGGGGGARCVLLQRWERALGGLARIGRSVGSAQECFFENTQIVVLRERGVSSPPPSVGEVAPTGQDTVACDEEIAHLLARWVCFV